MAKKINTQLYTEIKKDKAKIKELEAKISELSSANPSADNITKESLRLDIDKKWIPTLESCKEISHLRSMKIKRELKSIIRRI